MAISHRSILHLEDLKIPQISEALKKDINLGLSKLPQDDLDNCSVDGIREKLKSKELPVVSKRQKRTEWMTDEILDLMEHRQSFNNSDRVQYNAINRLIRKKVRETKEEHLLESGERETLQLLHENFHLHKPVKQSCGQFRSQRSTTLRNTNRRFILLDQELYIFSNIYSAAFGRRPRGTTAEL